MQSSSSFSSSRSGRPRPANLPAVSTALLRSASANAIGGGSESLPWPSPSFNLEHASALSPPQTGMKEIFADPGRPSSSFKNGEQTSYFKLRSPVSNLPPTPQTASNELPPEFIEQKLENVNNNYSGLSVDGDKLSPKLSSSNDGAGTSLPHLAEMLASAALASPAIGTFSDRPLEPLPFNAAPPRLVRSSSGHFDGPRASWTTSTPGSPPITVGVNPVSAPRMRTSELPDFPQDAYMRTPQPDSMIPSSWNPSTSSVMGLGLQFDATPRASDCMGSRREYTFRVPGASPSAPSLQPIEQGVFPTFPAALASPSLGGGSDGWNTDLHFKDEGVKEQEMDKEVREPATEKEMRQIEIMEGEMPRGGAAGGLTGLGIFFDGNLPTLGPLAEASGSKVELYGEEERTSAAHTMASLALLGVAPSAPVASSSSSSAPSTSRPTPKRAQSHINLKPHVHKMRLGAVKKASASEESGRDKGKKRSEALVRQVSSSSMSKEHQKYASPTVSPKKRSLDLDMDLDGCVDEDGEEMDMPVEEIQIKLPGSVAMERETPVAFSDSTNGAGGSSSSRASTPTGSRTTTSSATTKPSSPFGVLRLGKKVKISSGTSKSSLRAQAQVSSFQLPSKSSSQLPSQSSEPQVWKSLVPGSMTTKAEKEKKASMKKQKRTQSEGSKERERPQLSINVKNFDGPLVNPAPSSAVPRKAFGNKSQNVSTPKPNGITNKNSSVKGQSLSSGDLGKGFNSQSTSPALSSSHRMTSPSLIH